MHSSFLTALPVYNEEHHLNPTLQEVMQFSDDILIVNDGSTDGTAQFLHQFCISHPQCKVLTHETNLGYGAALRSAFEFAIAQRYEHLVTIDCDGQHEPQLIPQIVKVAQSDDTIAIVSGSRYLEVFENDSKPPADRQQINLQITADLNQKFHLGLTDSFCGFKAYRVEDLKKFQITETGYAMPLQLWIQAVAHNMKIVEFPVPLVYLEEERSFGGSLDDSEKRYLHYQEVLQREIERTLCDSVCEESTSFSSS